jgi:hypothetical protein
VFGLLFEMFEILFGLVSGTVGLTGHFDGILNVLFLCFEFLFKFDINVFHGIFLFSELVDFLSEFVIVGTEFIEFLVGPHEFVFKILSLLERVVNFGGMCNGFALLLVFVDFEFFFLFF